MRYDDPKHLEVWRQLKRFPSIHHDLFKLILDRASGNRYCDLCGHTGLLGQRILEMIPSSFVVGVDGDYGAIERSLLAGITYPRLTLTIDRTTVGRFAKYLVEHHISVLVARRCFPELFGADPELRPIFADAIATAGIKEVFLQGRAPTSRDTHPIPTVNEEIACIDSRFTVVYQQGQLAYLRVKGHSNT